MLSPSFISDFFVFIAWISSPLLNNDSFMTVSDCCWRVMNCGFGSSLLLWNWVGQESFSIRVLISDFELGMCLWRKFSSLPLIEKTKEGLNWVCVYEGSFDIWFWIGYVSKKVLCSGWVFCFYEFWWSWGPTGLISYYFSFYFLYTCLIDLRVILPLHSIKFFEMLLLSIRNKRYLFSSLFAFVLLLFTWMLILVMACLI